jgi:hypothetical protein
VQQTGQGFYEVFHFLRLEEALQLKRIQDGVNAGKLDVIELYRAAAPIFRAEQEATGRGRRRRDRDEPRVHAGWNPCRDILAGVSDLESHGDHGIDSDGV